MVGNSLDSPWVRTLLEEPQEFLFIEARLGNYGHESTSFDLVVSWNRNYILVFDKIDVAPSLSSHVIPGLSQGLDDITPRKDWKLA
jgi:hypothetical protein